MRRNLSMMRLRAEMMERAAAICPVLCRGVTGDATNLLVDKKSWLEVHDAHHRYGKNLRVYYDAWKRQGRPCGSFWEWLDVDPAGAGLELPACPRACALLPEGRGGESCRTPPLLLPRGAGA